MSFSSNGELAAVSGLQSGLRDQRRTYSPRCTALRRRACRITSFSRATDCACLLPVALGVLRLGFGRRRIVGLPGQDAAHIPLVGAPGNHAGRALLELSLREQKVVTFASLGGRPGPSPLESLRRHATRRVDGKVARAVLGTRRHLDDRLGGLWAEGNADAAGQRHHEQSCEGSHASTVPGWRDGAKKPAVEGLA